MAVVLKTEIPGAFSRALFAEREKDVARGPFHSTKVFIKKAHGAVIEDVDGNHLLDFACGIGVTNVGQTPESVVAAVRAQAGQFLHAGFNVTPYESYVRVAQKLNASFPGTFSKKSLLVNSGAEAVENAIKIARAHTKRQAVVCFEHAFHGRTYMAMTLTSKVKPYKYGFAPFCPEVYRAPFPDCYRWPTGREGDGEHVSAECFAAFEQLIQTQIGASQVAAVIIEPVLGEGGFMPAPVSFLKKLREFCTREGVVLIFDEVQSGFGRTGSLFACQQLGVTPDLLTSAKGLAAGLPLAAVVGRADVMDAPVEGGVGGTYGGNPVACAAALAVFELFEKNQSELLRRAQTLGERLSSRLHRWRETFPCVGHVRGLGPMQAVELVKSKATKEPDKEAAARVASFCLQNGLVLLTAGTFGNVLRFLIPLVISDSELDEGLAIVERGLKEVK